MEREKMILLGLERATQEGLKVKKRGTIFRVTNNEGDSTYSVQTLNNMILSCDCPHNQYRKVTCKHMFAVMLTSRSKYNVSLT